MPYFCGNRRVFYRDSAKDLKAAQKELQEANDSNELKTVLKKWRKIGSKNVCKLWLEERTPEELKGEGG
jgi:hypothetical protein